MIKQFCIYILDFNYIIRSSIITFNKLEKDNIINLRFQGIRNTLLDCKPRDKSKNKMLESIKQKIVLKPFK
jgi:hypothetical protein